MKCTQGNRYFSKTYVAKLCLQISLWPESKPFGLHVLSGIFQVSIGEVNHGFGGLPAYEDDAIIFSATRAEHYSRLKLAINCQIEKNVSIKPTIFKFGFSHLAFVGFKYSKWDSRPESDHRKPLVRMWSPRSQARLRSITGVPATVLPIYTNFPATVQSLSSGQSSD